MTERVTYMIASAVVVFIILVIALAGCAPPPDYALHPSTTPQARYLTSSTAPICLFLCTTVVTSNEAAQFPELRRAGDASGNSKSTTSSSTVTTP